MQARSFHAGVACGELSRPLDLVAITAVYREKGQATANRESFVLPAAIGDAIDFLVTIREEGYPQGHFV
jgi:hypothetical protein